METDVTPKFKKIIGVENFKYKQLITASSEAKIIAVSPPKKRNAIKIAASEKLIPKFERGNIKLNLELTDSVNANKIKNRQSIIASSRLYIAKIKQKQPRVVIANLKNEIAFC